MTIDLDEFLAAHPSLVPLIEEARREIKRYFPEETETRLEAASDPEYFHEEAVLYIIVDTEPDKATQALSDFDYGWWLDHLNDHLCITLEFV